MIDNLWCKATLDGDAWCTNTDTDTDTDNDTDTDIDTDTNTNTDTYTNTNTDTDTDGGRVIMGEVSLQKSFPYSGCMCRCEPFSANLDFKFLIWVLNIFDLPPPWLPQPDYTY